MSKAEVMSCHRFRLLLLTANERRSCRLVAQVSRWDRRAVEGSGNGEEYLPPACNSIRVAGDPLRLPLQDSRPLTLINGLGVMPAAAYPPAIATENPAFHSIVNKWFPTPPFLIHL